LPLEAALLLIRLARPRGLSGPTEVIKRAPGDGAKSPAVRAVTEFFYASVYTAS